MDITEQTYRAFSRLPGTQTPEFSSRLNPRYDPEHFALSITPGNLLLALHRAREARELALSYRGFKVGAALVALSIGSPSRFQILTGINVKPDKDSDLNGHAEQMALQMADDREFNAISMIAVVGETQPDQQSRLEMHTLHPCGLCRNVLVDHPMINPRGTLIVSALPTLQTIEISTLEGLLAYHSPDRPDPKQVKHFEFPDLELFRPFKPSSEEPVKLEDTDESIAEERLWNDSVGTFLAEHRNRLLLATQD